MNLEDLFDMDLYKNMVDERYVKVQTHPVLRYVAVLNYTAKAQYENVWNDVTRRCRGLICDLCSGEILARPFEKFFNYGQEGAPTLGLEDSVIVTDKLDGSLGILYPAGGDKYAIATRGSFTSDQAIHATEVWNRKYAGKFTPDPTITYLFEIIYPENRVVLDYGDLDDIVLLEEIDTETGEVVRGLPEWPGKSTPYFSSIWMLGDALAQPPRPNAEGYVIRCIAGGKNFNARVKLKQEDYVALHRVITGLNARLVWEYMRSDNLESLLETLPDEFHEWVKETAYELRTTYKKIKLQAQMDVYRYHTPVRKEFAERVKANSEVTGLCFMLYDDKDISDTVWKMIRPEANITPARTFSEETA